MAINLTFHGSKTINTLGIGVFDGVHQGHQALLNHCDSLLTFNPHPATITQQISTIKRLTTIEEMIYYVPNLISLEFNKTIQTLSAEEFLNTIILHHIKPKKVVIGYDYHFGKNRKGTPNYFQEWGKQNNIPVTIINPISHENNIVKSRDIRATFESGQFNSAVTKLGHPYLIVGTVIKGDGRGKELGFPTANITYPENKLIPTNGVYKGYVLFKNKTYKAMIYIGKKPTFSSNNIAVEIFMLNFNQDCYHQKLHLFIETFLRTDVKFTSKEKLIQQIKEDIFHAFNN